MADPAGWAPLADVGVGELVAAPRRRPGPVLQLAWTDDRVLAHAADVAADAEHSRATGQVAHLPERQVRLFLRRLWQLAGHPAPASAGVPPVLLLGTPALDDASRLLRRFGISGARTSDPDSLAIVEPADVLRFWTAIALAGPREEPFGQRPTGDPGGARHSGA